MPTTIRAASLVRAATLVLALGWAASACAGTDPTHGPGKRAFEAFVIDALPELVVGQRFEADGHEYEVTRLHQITRTNVDRTRAVDVNNDVAAVGWVFAVVHVKVDGRLERARIEGNARYMNGPEGWEWDRVLIYLGRNDSYDFVSERNDR